MYPATRWLLEFFLGRKQTEEEEEEEDKKRKKKKLRNHQPHQDKENVSLITRKNELWGIWNNLATKWSPRWRQMAWARPIHLQGLLRPTYHVSTQGNQGARQRQVWRGNVEEDTDHFSRGNYRLILKSNMPSVAPFLCGAWQMKRKRKPSTGEANKYEARYNSWKEKIQVVHYKDVYAQ
jgi:hypothetical protein